MFLVTLDSPKIFRSKASKAHSGRVHQAPASWASAACSGRHTVLPLPGHRGTAQCCARWNDTYSGWFQKKWGDFSKDLGANQEQDGIGVQNLADFAKKNQDHNRIMNDHAPTCPLFLFPYPSALWPWLSKWRKFRKAMKRFSAVWSFWLLRITSSQSWRVSCSKSP